MSEPTPEGPFGRRPLPRSTDWRRALDVYVAGRSRALTFEEKRVIAGSTASPTSAASPTSVASPTSPGHAADATEPGTGALTERKFGVPIPDVLAYHRNASTWRNGLFEGGTRNVARD